MTLNIVSLLMVITAIISSFMADPKMAPAAYNLCIMLSKDQIDEAIGFCKKASDIRPDNPKYANTLSFYLYQKGDTKEAIRTLNILVQKYPE